MESLFDLETLVRTAGYAGLFAIIFSESGLLIGVLFPGDSLLFTAGFVASQGYLDIYFLAAIAFAAAVLGDSVGYAFGYRIGPRIFTRENSLFFHKDHVVRAERFYERYGKKTIILARFMPIVRTLAPIIAGVGKMHYSTFLAYNVIGGLIWGVGVTLLGFFLGTAIPGVDRYLFLIVLLIIVTSFLPPLYRLVRFRDDRVRAANFVRDKITRRRRVADAKGKR